MAQHIIHPLFELDIRDPSFRIAASSWAAETQDEMDGMVADTKRMIASSKVLLAEVDLILAQQTVPPSKIGKRQNEACQAPHGREEHNL